MEKVSLFLQRIASSIQVCNLYNSKHPRFERSLTESYQLLKEILSREKEIVIGLVKGEFSYKDEIFFELSRRLESLVKLLSSKDIHRLTFTKDITFEELADFIKLLVEKKDLSKQQFSKEFQRFNFKNIDIGTIQDDASATKAKDKNFDYHKSLELIGDFFRRLLTQKNLNKLEVNNTVNGLFQRVSKGDWQFLVIESVKEHDVATFIHSLNVSTLSMFFSSRLGFDKENIVKIGVAALFHDMGKVAITKKIIQKDSALTDAEFEEMKSHAVRGGEILLKYVDSLGYLPSIVAFEHHLRHDLTGYPSLNYSHKPNVASLIVALADCYDALRSRRSYKQDYPPEMIYKIMNKERGRMFEPRLFDEFFKAIGVYPINTVVKLSNAHIAIVSSQKVDDIWHPHVKIIEPASSQGKIISTAEQGYQIDHSLNPLTEGKKYLSKI
jgi:HD-GYP domain-containing protein (c-di-GMP phosphodiesterase class II)